MTQRSLTRPVSTASDAWRAPSASRRTAALPGGAAGSVRWLAAGGIGAALLVMIAAALLRNDWQAPPLAAPSGGPPWILHVRVSAQLAFAGTCLAAAAGGIGVVAGLAAVRRGARPSARLLLLCGLAAAGVLAVLAPAGSTDVLNYATFGRITALGHNPYLYTPYQLRGLGGAFARAVPHNWDRHVSVYGPLATAEQYLAARLGGDSMARTVLWLKLWNFAAFAAVALAADRVLRPRPRQRLRAHLLWTVNPLILWALIEAGHLDLLAAAAGLAALAVLAAGRGGSSAPSWPRVLAAGALVGVAADLKVNYLLFGAGAVWALRRSPARLAGCAVAAAAVLLPSYAWFGRPAISAVLARRNVVNAATLYQLALDVAPHWRAHVPLAATVLAVVAAVILLWRLPAALPGHPAVRPVVAVSAAWLCFWPYQEPWYDAMIICVLLLYPATRLDWLILARLTATTIASVPPGAPPPGHVLASIYRDIVLAATPAVLLIAAVCLLALCVTGRWDGGPSRWPRALAAPPARWWSGPALVSAGAGAGAPGTAGASLSGTGQEAAGIGQ